MQIDPFIISTLSSVLLAIVGGTLIVEALTSLVLAYKKLRLVMRSGYQSEIKIKPVKGKPHRISSGQFSNRLRP